MEVILQGHALAKRGWDPQRGHDRRDLEDLQLDSVAVLCLLKLTGRHYEEADAHYHIEQPLLNLELFAC